MANNAKKRISKSLIFTWILIVLFVAGTVGVIVHYTANNSKFIQNDQLADALAEKLDKPAGKITKKDLTSVESVEVIIDGATFAVDENGNMVYDMNNLIEVNSITLYLKGFNAANDAYYAEGVTDEQRKSLTDPGSLVVTAELTDTEILEDVKLFTGAESITLYDYDPSTTETLDFATFTKGFDKLEELTVYGFGTKNFNEVSKLVNLKSLIVYSDTVEDISAIKPLSKLETLSITSSKVTDISAIENLTSLKNITLDGGVMTADGSTVKGNITKIPSLAKLTALENLDLSNNRIADITPLAAIKDETILSLNISGNEITDYSPIAHISTDKVVSDEEKPEETEENNEDASSGETNPDGETGNTDIPEETDNTSETGEDEAPENASDSSSDENVNTNGEENAGEEVTNPQQ